MKQQLNDQVKTYTDAFAQWIESSAKIARSLAVISAETRQMLPAADEIIASAGQQGDPRPPRTWRRRRRRPRCSSSRSASRVVLIGWLLSWLIGRSITGPLAELSGAMEQLATGDTSVEIPATEAKDEIGAMARTVIVFRDNALEREQLAVTQEKSVRERERRAETIDGTIASFESTDRRGARQSARRRATAGDRRHLAQRRGRCGLGASRAPPRSASERPR